MKLCCLSSTQITSNSYRRQLILLHQPFDMDYPQVTMWIKNYYNKHSQIKFWHVGSHRHRIVNVNVVTAN